MAQIFGTGTVVFRFRKAELAGAFCFAQESGYSIFYGIFLADNDTGEGIFGFGNKEIIVISGGIYIRRIGGLYQFVQTRIQHIVDERGCIILYQITHVAFLLVRSGFVLVEDEGLYIGLFLVLINQYNRLLVVVYRIVLAFGSIGLGGNIRKHFLDLGFDGVHIYIANYHNTLKVWTVPLFIVVSQSLRFEVHNDLHRSDRETSGILRSFEHDWKHLLLEALYGAHTGAPFFVDDSAFLVYFLRVQGQIVTPVVQNQQAGVDGSRSSDRHIGNVVYGFVYGSIGVQVLTEFHPDTLQVLLQCITGEVGRSIETHVFQEVGKAALVGFFLNGAYLLGNVKVGPVCRLAVLADIIGQSVVQLSDTDIFVDRDRRHLLCKYLLKIAAKN